MDKESLGQLIAISRAVGANRDDVQAGGGNTSVKSPDGRAMAIKASGTPLTAMSEAAGWVELDTAGVLSIFDRSDLAALDANTREARVLQHLFSAVCFLPSAHACYNSPPWPKRTKCPPTQSDRSAF
jgi:rhamnose utilization protein RhaD (predicted bifunctional aldolase and dehydrogenase)